MVLLWKAVGRENKSMGFLLFDYCSFARKTVLQNVYQERDAYAVSNINWVILTDRLQIIKELHVHTNKVQTFWISATNVCSRSRRRKGDFFSHNFIFE